jgi:hypothetical protein
MRDFKTDPITQAEIEEFVRKNPAVIAMAGALVFQVLSKVSERPAYLKDCPPLRQRLAGPWRGKGSFGHGFGHVKVHHK